MEITKDELLQVIGYTLLIDVRTKQEFNNLKKIEGAINAPINDLLKNPGKFIPSKNTFTVVYCNAGNRSGQAAYELSHLGYNVKVLAGGVYRF